MIEKYACTIKTITPVHIGAGSEKVYNSSEYIHGKIRKFKSINKVNVSNYYQSLPEEDKDNFLDELMNPDFLLETYKQEDSNIKDYVEYKSIDQIKRYEETKSTHIEIKENIKTQNKIYIPGSSIKGSLKTVLLYNDIKKADMNSIEKIISRNHLNKREYYKFLEDFFVNSEKKIFGKKVNGAQKDIMKYIQITDSSTMNIPYIYNIKTIQATEQGKYNLHKDKKTRNTVYNYLETIGTGNTLTTELKLNNNPKILEIMGLTDKSKLLNLDYIKQSLYNYAEEYIYYELDFAEKYQIDFLEKFYSDLIKKNTEDQPLLRIGQGSGFMSTTIGMKIKELDSRTYENIRNSLKTTTYNYEFPKSRKICCISNKPLGWTKLTFEQK